jgi:hypothetical protein
VRLAIAVLALGACWRGPATEPAPIASAPTAAPDAARRRPPPVEDPEPSPDAAVVVVVVVPASADAGPTPLPGAPGCLVARIISVAAIGGDLEVVVGRGRAAGVTASWTARLQDPARTPAQITRVDAQLTRMRLANVTVDRVAVDPRIELCP